MPLRRGDDVYCCIQAPSVDTHHPSRLFNVSSPRLDDQLGRGSATAERDTKAMTGLDWCPSLMVVLYRWIHPTVSFFCPVPFPVLAIERIIYLTDPSNGE